MAALDKRGATTAINTEDMQGAIFEKFRPVITVMVIGIEGEFEMRGISDKTARETIENYLNERG
jgi:hypothetical protein